MTFLPDNHYAHLGDVTLHYVTAGSWRPLVLLHGWQRDSQPMASGRPGAVHKAINLFALRERRRLLGTGPLCKRTPGFRLKPVSISIANDMGKAWEMNMHSRDQKTIDSCRF